MTGERIDEGGRSVQESVPWPKGDEAAIRAAAQWALEPLLRDEPVACRVATFT